MAARTSRVDALRCREFFREHGQQIRLVRWRNCTSQAIPPLGRFRVLVTSYSFVRAIKSVCFREHLGQRESKPTFGAVAYTLQTCFTGRRGESRPYFQAVHSDGNVLTSQKHPRKVQVRWHRRPHHPLFYVCGRSCNCNIVSCPANRLVYFPALAAFTFTSGRLR